ncbi:MAG TPA: glycine cleavage system protein GcvH [Acidimicrobiales bacterium]|nr:glycine cleavage system protein GcvH [Acidimicrobiales bacterium]
MTTDEVPDDRRYTDDHEWAQQTDEGIRIGITHYAQDALGDVVFVKLPDIGAEVGAHDAFSEVESTKSVSEVYAPLDGSVVAVNESLTDDPGRLNTDPYGTGWICVLRPVDGAAYDSLLDAGAYRSLISD